MTFLQLPDVEGLRMCEVRLAGSLAIYVECEEYWRRGWNVGGRSLKADC